MTSSASRRTAPSWVATTNVTPASTNVRTPSITSRPDSVSSSAVGSSATTTAEPATTAWANAARCCSPPESSSGRWSMRWAMPSRSRISVSPRTAGPARGESQMVTDREVRQEVVRGPLEHVADHVPPETPEPARRRLAHVPLAHPHVAGRRSVDAGQHPQERGLPAPRRPDDRGERPGRKAERHPAERVHRAGRRSIRLHEVDAARRHGLIRQRGAPPPGRPWRHAGGRTTRRPPTPRGLPAGSRARRRSVHRTAAPAGSSAADRGAAR